MDEALEAELAAALNQDDGGENVADEQAAAAAPADATAEQPAAPADDAAAAAEPAAAGAKQAEPKAEPKPGDELYAPLPETNPRKTHERFARLVEGHKQVSAERDTIAGERDQLKAKVQEHEQGWQQFRELGFDSQESVRDLEQFSAYRTALIRRDWDGAAAQLQKQAEQLSLISGRRIDVNPLSRFQDLSQRTQSGELDEPTALEIARGRTMQAQSEDAMRQRQDGEQAHQAQMQAIRGGALAVDRLVMDLQRDPDFTRVAPELEKRLQSIKETYPPHLWAPVIKQTYDYEARILRSAQQTAAAVQQPLRGNGHSGGKPAPASMEQAVLQNLGFE